MKLEQLKQVMKTVESPIQPFLQRHTVDYKSRAIPLNPLCEKGDALVYQFTTDDRSEQTVLLLPDGCIDLLFCCDVTGPRAFFTGYQDQSRGCVLKPNQTYFGIKPYSGFLGLKSLSITPRECYGQQVSLDDVLKTGLLEGQIAEAASMDERIHLFQQYWLEHYLDRTYISSLAGYISLRLCCSGGKVSLEQICEDTGYSSRYCRKIFSNSYGLSIREYSQMIRFQRVLRELCKGDRSIGEIAYENGFSDEAHLVNNFKAWSGTAPQQFRRNVMQAKA